MQQFRVSKTFEFSYGHRLLAHQGKCKHLHGHNGMVEIEIETEAVDQMGMVVDFSVIGEVAKTWVDETLDHKMLLDRTDPLVPILQAAGEPLFLMAENPTAENLARLIWQASRERGLQVSEVRVWETSTSRASFRGSD